MIINLRLNPELAPTCDWLNITTDNGFLSPSKQSRLGIKIVLINITNGTTAVVASGFQRPLSSFHANSIDGSVTESIALTFWQAILRKSRFQVNKQNNQGPEVVWFDWQS